MKKSLLLLFTFIGLLTALPHKAYNQNIDSLFIAYKQAPSDTAKLDIASKLISKLSQTDPDSSITIALESYSLSTEVPSIKRKAVALLDLGRSYIRTGAYQNALKYLTKASEFNKSDKLDGYTKGEILRSIGNIYFIQYKPDEAMSYYKESLLYFKSVDDTLAQAAVYGNIGNILYEEGSLDSALYYNKLALTKRLDQNSENDAAISYLNMAMLYDAMDSTQLAIDYSLKALNYAEKTDSKVMMTYPLKVLSSVYRKLGKLSEAISYAQQSLQLAKDLNVIYEQKDAHSNLARSYAALKNYEMAYFHLENQKALNDSLLNEDANQRLAEMRAVYETEKAKQENMLLVAENTLQKTRAFAITTTLLVVLLFVVLFYTRVISKKKQELELLEKNKIIVESKKKLADEALANSTIKSEHLQKELTNYALHIVEKNEFLKSINKELSQLKSDIANPDAIKGINKLGHRVYQNSMLNKDREEFEIHVEQACTGFFKKLEHGYPDLTTQERRLAALLRLNLSSKDISGILNISPKSVDQSRYRLRKKLRLDKSKNLTLILNQL